MISDMGQQIGKGSMVSQSRQWTCRAQQGSIVCVTFSDASLNLACRTTARTASVETYDRWHRSELQPAGVVCVIMGTGTRVVS
eukprot:scaffold562383_cov20-Prasinocladus_malaysianus.AAC.1